MYTGKILVSLFRIRYGGDRREGGLLATALSQSAGSIYIFKE